MKNNRIKKLLLLPALVLLAAVMVLVIFSYQRRFMKTEVDRFSSEDGQYRLVITEIGLPDFPDGDTRCRLTLRGRVRKIKELETVVHNDGLRASKDQFEAVWQEQSVLVKVEEGNGDTAEYELFYDGR